MITVMLLRLPSCLNMLWTAASCFWVVISLHDQLSLHAFLAGCSLGHLAQQDNMTGLFERPVQEEYEVKSKVCEPAVMNSKKEMAAMVKEKSALQQQLKVSCVGTLLFTVACCNVAETASVMLHATAWFQIAWTFVSESDMHVLPIPFLIRKAQILSMVCTHHDKGMHA